ncbi:hypothetical protein SOVF_029020 [Spinacia oleracea]|nr:hypothetical protein SOVF_029020 [Spinacia oleracea]
MRRPLRLCKNFSATDTFEVGPMISLDKCDVLQWCLNKLVIQDDGDEEDGNHAAEEDANHTAVVEEYEIRAASAEVDANHVHAAVFEE